MITGCRCPRPTDQAPIVLSAVPMSHRLATPAMGLCEADLVDVPYAAVPVVLETDRLRLVPLDSSRAEELAEIYADPEVARYIGGDRLTGEGTLAQVAVFEQVWR